MYLVEKGGTILRKNVGKVGKVKAAKIAKTDVTGQITYLERLRVRLASRLFAFVQREINQGRSDNGLRNNVIYDQELAITDYSIIMKIREAINKYLNKKDVIKIITWLDHQDNNYVLFLLSSFGKIDTIPFLFGLEDKRYISGSLGMDSNAPFIIKTSELSKKLINALESDHGEYNIYGQNFAIGTYTMKGIFYECKRRQTKFQNLNEQEKEEKYKLICDNSSQIITSQIVQLYNQARSYFFKKYDYDPNSDKAKQAIYGKEKLINIIYKINSTGKPTKADMIGLSGMSPSLLENKTPIAIEKQYERGEIYFDNYARKLSDTLDKLIDKKKRFTH